MSTPKVVMVAWAADPVSAAPSPPHTFVWGGGFWGGQIEESYPELRRGGEGGDR